MICDPYTPNIPNTRRYFMAEHELLHVEEVALARYELILPALDENLAKKDRLERMRFTSNNINSPDYQIILYIKHHYLIPI